MSTANPASSELANAATATATATATPATTAATTTTEAAPTTESQHKSTLLSEEQQAYLERRLANRPDVESLTNAGIIKQGGRFAAQQAALQRELHQDALARSLDSRPSIETLVDAGIVQTGVAPGLQAVAKKLERNIITDHLNQKLYARESPESLAAHHATLFRGNDVAPRLRDAKVRLEHAITRDHVGHLLESRPDPYDLVRANVAPPTHVSSRIAGAQRALQHHMTQDRVGHLLERRSSLEALQHQNILKDVRVAPALQGTQRALERNLAKANLYHALQHRPTLSELKQKGVLPETFEPYYEEEPQTRTYSHSASAPSYEPAGYQRRSKNFHLTRILLKFVATMAEAGEISLHQKGYLKDLIVDQDKTILAVAETFDAENDLHDFKDSLVRLASRR